MGRSAPLRAVGPPESHHPHPGTPRSPHGHPPHRIGGFGLNLNKTCCRPWVNGEDVTPPAREQQRKRTGRGRNLVAGGSSGRIGGVPKTQPRVTRRRLSPADVRSELDVWEARYGVPSDRLADAFCDTAGRLVETDDFHAWSQTYDTWLHVGAR